jgi:hypothetical protein
MVKCNERCQLYNRCDCRGLQEQCVFDMGIYVKEKDDDDDEFLEKVTY